MILNIVSSYQIKYGNDFVSVPISGFLKAKAAIQVFCDRVFRFI